MPLLRAHPAPIAVLLAAFAAVSWVFLFARPEYRPEGATGHAVSGAAYEAPLHGWSWRGGLPGGGVESDAAEVLLAHVTRAELAPARQAAARAGVDPASVRPLRVARYESRPGGFAAILAGRGARGRTCLGFVVPGRGTSFVCPQRQKAFLVATALPVQRSKRGATHGMFLLGIASGDVERVSVTQWTVWTDMRGPTPRVVRETTSVDAYDRRGGWWGTFLASAGGANAWETRVTLGGTTQPVRLSGPGSRLVVVR